MEKKVLSFKGISRAVDSGISEDGACMELINARIDNELVTPIAKPVLAKNFGKKYDMIFKHVGSEYENLICVRGFDVEAYVTGDDGTERVTTILTGDAEIKSIESIGNTLSVITAKEIVYFIYKDDMYYNLGTKLPMPLINFSLEYDSEESVPGTAGPYGDSQDGFLIWGSKRNAWISLGSKQLVWDLLIGNANKLISKTSEAGLFISPILVRYAIRLYDGTYMRHSAPILLLPPSMKTMIGECKLSRDSDHWYIAVNVTAKKYRLMYNILNFDSISQWSDLIQSIDVFISKPISQFDLDYPFMEKSDFNVTASRVTLYYRSDNDIKTDIIESSAFYELDKLSVSYLPLSGSLSKKGMLDNLEQKQTLTDDEYTNNEITGSVSYVYNTRLHLANVTKTIFGGYDANIFANLNETIWDKTKLYTYAAGYTIVKIETEDGTKTVRSDYKAMGKYGFTPYLSYPDIRAKSITIVTYDGKEEVYISYPLKPHPYLNLAYFLNSLDAINDFPNRGKPKYTLDNTERKVNSIYVSEVNNPFYFPAKNTYTPSAYEVVAMCSNTEPISTGQFGQYPLYVFCKDGVYSMSVDVTGTTTYSHSAPVSRDVCTNANVLPLDKAVAFITDSGLMIIYGGTTERVSADMDGWLPTVIDNTPILGDVLNIAKLGGSRSVALFRDFLKDARLGYVYEEREIIVSNPAYNYSYVYSFNSKTWSKISTCVAFYVKTYPGCLAVVNRDNVSSIYNMYNRQKGLSDIAVITRPVKFGSISYKRIFQAVLRCYIRTGGGIITHQLQPFQLNGNDLQFSGRAGFYMLGSNDAEHFELVGGSDRFSEIRDVVVQMKKSKAYKYFVFCLSGTMRTDASVNFLELSISEVLGNRFR